MNTNRHEERWICLAAATSREEAPPGSAGVPPAQHWHSLTPLSHPARPAIAPRFRFSRAHGVPGGRVTGRRFTGKRSGHPTQRMRARRPRSRRAPLPWVLVDRSFFFCFSQAAPPPWRADHTRVKHSIVNKGEPRMNTNRHKYRWTCLAATTSREEGPAGSAGVPPAQHWHSLTHLSHPARPAMAPRFRFSRAQAVPAGRAAGCRFTGKRSGHPTQRMRARRPRSRRGASPMGLGGFLLFLLFQPSSAPALPGGSYEGATLNRQ